MASNCHQLSSASCWLSQSVNLDIVNPTRHQTEVTDISQYVALDFDMLNVCQKYGIFIGKHICNNNSCLWEQKLVKHRCLLSSNTSVVLSQRSHIYSVKHFHCFLYQCRCAALLLLSATIHLCHSLVHYRSNRHRINNDNGDASVDAAYIHLQ